MSTNAKVASVTTRPVRLAEAKRVGSPMMTGTRASRTRRTAVSVPTVDSGSGVKRTLTVQVPGVEPTAAGTPAVQVSPATITKSVGTGLGPEPAITSTAAGTNAAPRL